MAQTCPGGRLLNAPRNSPFQGIPPFLSRRVWAPILAALLQAMDYLMDSLELSCSTGTVNIDGDDLLGKLGLWQNVGITWVSFLPPLVMNSSPAPSGVIVHTSQFLFLA